METEDEREKITLGEFALIIKEKLNEHLWNNQVPDQRREIEIKNWMLIHFPKVLEEWKISDVSEDFLENIAKNPLLFLNYIERFSLFIQILRNLSLAAPSQSFHSSFSSLVERT